MLDRPLAGVRVLDLATGPLAAMGRMLADLGAQVIRVEPHGGAADRTQAPCAGGVGLEFVAQNLGKQAVALDLCEAADRQRFAALVAGADILIEATAPGSREAAALGVESLFRMFPALVILSVTPFGATGSYAQWQATDPVLHALSGELSRSGIAGRAPLLPPGEIAQACAMVQAVYVILLAFYSRLRSGFGDHLDFSLLEAAGQALDPGFGIAGSASLGVSASELPRGRIEARHQYPIIPCKDGHVRICVLSPRQWQGMFEWMGRPASFADASYAQLSVRFASPDLVPAIACFFAGFTRAELEAAGQRHGVPTAALLSLEEALASEQIATRQALRSVETAPGVIITVPDGALEIDGQRLGATGGPPALCDAMEGQGLCTWTPPGGDPPDPRDLEGKEGASHPTHLQNQSSAPSLPSKSWRPGASPGGGRGGKAPRLPSDGERPLDGLRVLDFGVIVVGAEQGRLLADQGAEVIKVETSAFPDGSRQSKAGGRIAPTFAAGHFNKQSFGVNLRDARGRDLVLRLVEQTDVILSNFKPGTLASLGLDFATLRQLNPRLIMVDSSAFGPTGPWSRRLGYGPLVRACTGLTRLWSYPGEDEGFSDALTVYPDHVAARIGAIGALALLIRRTRTGRGGTASVAQNEVMLSHMATRIAQASLGALDALRDAPWGVFPCAGDDEWCVVTVRGDSDWQRLCEAIGRPDLAADPPLANAVGRDSQRGRIDEALQAWLMQHSPVEAMETLQAAGVPAGAMLRVIDLPRFPFFVERGAYRQVTHPWLAKPFFRDAAPVRSRRLPAPPDRPAPLLGEHTEAIAAERLDLSKAEIAALIEAKVLEGIEA